MGAISTTNFSQHVTHAAKSAADEASLSSFSLGNILATNIGDLIHSVYVFSPCLVNLSASYLLSGADSIYIGLGNRSLVISLTNLADLQAGKRGDGDSTWLEIKQKGMN